MYNMKEKTSKVTDSLILGEVAQGKELSIRNNEDITDAEIIEDDDKFWAEENHPNFIESLIPQHYYNLNFLST